MLVKFCEKTSKILMAGVSESDITEVVKGLSSQDNKATAK